MLHGLCVVLLELLVDDVYVAEEVDVFVEDAERVVAPDPVCVGEEDAEPVADIVRAGPRVRVPVTVSVTEGRRLTLPQEVEVAVRVPRAVTVTEAVPVSLKEPLRVPVTVRERGAVGVSARQRVGVAELDRVFDWAELRVGVGLVFRERERAGDEVPVLEGAMLLVNVPDAVGVLEPAPLRVVVEDTVDVFD